LNLIEPEEVATAAILTNHLPQWGYPITRPIAAALLTGIVTDTLGFRTSNTNPSALRLCAALMETGVDMADLYMKALVEKTFSAARYWGAGLSRLEQKNGMVWATLTLEDRKAAGYRGNDDADLINMISSIEGNKVGITSRFLGAPWNRASTFLRLRSILVAVGMPPQQGPISRAI
jgi:phosphoesterase RecJ-like protein